MVRTFAFQFAVVVLLALLVREYFVLATIVEVPIRGDIREYVAYAWNLAHRGVFGMSPPDVPAIPDAYRSPGFPWLIALCMKLAPAHWYGLALQCQVLLGTCTVAFTMLVARHWLQPGWSAFAGLLLALWPHHVAASGALLSEVAFGWTLSAGLLGFAVAMRSPRTLPALVASAAAFGLGYLVNPLIALFPPVLALLAWKWRGRTAALWFLLVFLLPVALFWARNAQLPQGANAPPSRAVINLVQGSWPQYHPAWVDSKHGDPAGTAVMHAVDDEIATLSRTPSRGLHQILARFNADRAYYVHWYLWEKVHLLWDWEIGVGSGGPYVLDVRNSPLDRHPLLAAAGRVLRTLNPLLTLVALLTAIALVARLLLLKKPMSDAAIPAALLLLYVTGIHDVFQAEPRYANAYRWVEVLMLATAAQVLAARVRRPKALGGT